MNNIGDRVKNNIYKLNDPHLLSNKSLTKQTSVLDN